MIIAIDGPAASGKSSLARLIAAHYKLPHLNTGSLYRAVARDVIAAGERLDGPFAAQAALRIDMATLGDPALQEAQLGDPASVVAALPEVRQALLAAQRDFILKARRGAGAVIEGRDIGTVICPDAEVKLFITASADARAKRRYLEAAEYDSAVDESAIGEALKRRDERDASRPDAPMQRAADAYLLDTTNLDIETALKMVFDYINSRATRS
ncbi:MAG: (d)CMP kinase [Hyphomicrobiales bacterium]|nr:(d)CMP kinase [Hyphomicrobiales bacterium]